MEINKSQLRREMISLRNELSNDEIQKNSKKIFDRICEHSIYKDSKCIFSYMSFRNEVDTREFHNRILEDHKVLLLPKVLSKTVMEFYEVSHLDQLVKSKMGILEPDETCTLYKDFVEKSLMIVPGVGFSKDFKRLGYGGGYYDRYLEKHKNYLVCCGAAFECQWVKDIPCLDHDFLMDLIVTESEWLERVDVL